MNSEEVFGIKQPVDYQCKTIDAYIEKVNKALSYVSDLDSVSSADDAKDLQFEIEYYLGDLDGDLEEIRRTFEKLRDWGQEWKELAKTVIKENNLSEEYATKFDTYVAKWIKDNMDND